MIVTEHGVNVAENGSNVTKNPARAGALFSVYFWCHGLKPLENETVRLNNTLQKKKAGHKRKHNTEVPE